MARKTKEIIDNEIKKIEKALEEKISKKSTPKKSSVNINKKTNSKKTTKSSSKSTTKTTSNKTTKNTTSQKSKSLDATKKTTKKNSANTKNPKTPISKTSKIKNLKDSSKEEIDITKLKKYTPEYYDLPFRYNQTVVKILAQTPNSLFIYWDISDEDRKKLQNTYGKHVFEITKPVLVVHNTTMNYYFEVDINDFANSWYLHINDSKCDYTVELGRRPIPINPNYIHFDDDEIKNNITFDDIKPVTNPYIYVSSSNKIESPNDKILFNDEKNTLYFRNIKTDTIIAKDIDSLSFIQNIGGIHKLRELYRKFYKDEDFSEENGKITFTNPGSGNPSSNSFSSKFK